MIYINDILFSPTKFPNGETNFPELLSKDPCLETLQNITILVIYESDNDLFNLIMIKKTIDNTVSSLSKIHLIMPYFPYERMDRVKNCYQVFSLKCVTSLINDLNFSSVTIWEPHSDVVSALLNHVRIVNATDCIYDGVRQANWESGISTISFAPDAGAQKRYKCPVVGIKSRNFKTGKIESYSISGDIEQLKQVDKVLILDDLCSYGGTFLLAANEIKQINPKVEINLIVTHCEKSIIKGDMIKSGIINKVYTTNSIITSDDIKNAGLENKIKIVENVYNVQNVEGDNRYVFGNNIM